jgi:hypothetical protein
MREKERETGANGATKGENDGERKRENPSGEAVAVDHDVFVEGARNERHRRIHPE